MVLRSVALFVFLLFAVSKSNAQIYEMGKVTVAELEEKMHPGDSAAAAAIIFNKRSMDIGIDGRSEQILKRRIKIYKKEGYEWSNVQIYFGAGNLSNLTITDACTYNLSDGKIVKSKLKPESEFVEKTTTNYWTKKLAFSDIKEGSIIEYQYKQRGGFITVYDCNFQEDIPVNYSEFKAIIPDSFLFKKNLKGFFAPKVNTQIAKTYGYGAMETTYVFQNLTAIKEESYVNNMNNYRSGISYELESVNIPGQLIKNFSTNWTSVAKTIYEFDSFGPELNKEGYYEEDLKLLLQGKVNPNEKMNAILDFVKSNISWNNHLGYSCEKGVRKAYKEKTGNAADINLMLTSMLRYAGLDANPVLISTRSNGIAFFPNLTAFNYVITAVEIANETILLDATDKFSAPNVLPMQDLNWIGRLIRKNGTSDNIDLVPKMISTSTVSANYSIDKTGKIKGKIRKYYTDYHAMAFRNNFENLKEDAYLEKLENDNNKIEVSEYTRTNEKEVLLPASETYNFSAGALCDIIGEKIYISPMLFFANTKNPFKQETREYPVDFGFPFKDKYNISIQIPEGYTIETLPLPGAITMEGGLGAFRYNITVSDNILQLLITHQINEAIVGVDQYEVLQEYYQTMIAKETEKIVLKRI